MTNRGDWVFRAFTDWEHHWGNRFGVWRPFCNCMAHPVQRICFDVPAVACTVKWCGVFPRIFTRSSALEYDYFFACLLQFFLFGMGLLMLRMIMGLKCFWLVRWFVDAAEIIAFFVLFLLWAMVAVIVLILMALNDDDWWECGMVTAVIQEDLNEIRRVIHCP